MRSASMAMVLLPALLAAETSRQRGQRVIDEALAALGGRRYLAMQDRVETGRAYQFYREELSGLAIATVYTRYVVRPEPPVAGFLGVREREAFGKDQANAVLFVDGQGYDITFRGARPLPDATLVRYKDSTLRNVLYILRMRLGEPGLVFESQGADVWENQPVEMVDIVDAAGRVVSVYFNQSTKLPVYQTFRRRNPEDREFDVEVTRLAKYRNVGGGVMWPYSIERERNREKIFEMYSESVTINKDLKDDLFTLPLKMKILKKEK